MSEIRVTRIPAGTIFRSPDGTSQIECFGASVSASKGLPEPPGTGFVNAQFALSAFLNQPPFRFVSAMHISDGAVRLRRGADMLTYRPQGTQYHQHPARPIRRAPFLRNVATTHIYDAFAGRRGIPVRSADGHTAGFAYIETEKYQ